MSGVVACGGAATSALFNDNNGGPGSEAGAGSSSGGRSSSSSGGSGGSSGGSSGSSSGSSSGGSSGGSSGSGSGSSSGGSSGGSSGSSSGGSSGGGSGGSSGGGSGGAVDAGPSDLGIRCGTVNGNAAYCPAATETCCVSGQGSQGGGSQPTFTCQLSSMPNVCFGVTVPCDDQADCPTGSVCCGTLGSNNRYVTVKCQTSCDGNNGEYEFCDPNAPVDECEAQGMSCQPSGVLPGYYRCAG